MYQKDDFKINELARELNELKIKFDFMMKRSLCVQESFMDYIIESAYDISDLHSDKTLECLLKNKQMIINKNMQALTDDKSLLDDYFQYFLGIKCVDFPYRESKLCFDIGCLFGLKDPYESFRIIQTAYKNKRAIIYGETGFLLSILPEGHHEAADEYRQYHSVLLDRKCMYTDARHQSDLEYMLNTIRVSKENCKHARKMIDKLVDTKITKYNYQPIKSVKIGNRKEKVLVVDQLYGDLSITLGLATDEVFSEMLQTAIRENPNADILVKTHPESNSTHKRRHYNKVDNGIIFVDYDINPFCLLEQVDKVYVCSSQLGFEALMCGKEVHTFGLPFYAGWGLTIDRLQCERRTKKRTLEEVFFIAYMMYNNYVSYRDKCSCGIEQTIDELIELRSEYWLSTRDE